MKNVGMGGPGMTSVKLDSAPPGYGSVGTADFRAACDGFFRSRGMRVGREAMGAWHGKKRKRAKG